MSGPGVVGSTLARLCVGLRVQGLCKEPRTRAEVVCSSSLFRLGQQGEAGLGSAWPSTEWPPMPPRGALSLRAAHGRCIHISELSWLDGGLWPVAAAGRGQADVAVSVLSSLVWNLGEWLVLPLLLESPRLR